MAPLDTVPPTGYNNVITQLAGDAVTPAPFRAPTGRRNVRSHAVRVGRQCQSGSKGKAGACIALRTKWRAGTRSAHGPPWRIAVEPQHRATRPLGLAVPAPSPGQLSGTRHVRADLRVRALSGRCADTGTIAGTGRLPDDGYSP